VLTALKYRHIQFRRYGALLDGDDVTHEMAELVERGWAVEDGAEWAISDAGEGYLTGLYDGMIA
jgi:hypothetical protein